MSASPSPSLDRRRVLSSLGVLGAFATLSPLRGLAAAKAPATVSGGASDSLAMQLYKSLSDEQLGKLVLPVDDPKRLFISNWWYIHKEHRVNEGTFSKDQIGLIQELFDSLHHPDFRTKVNQQVEKDLMGDLDNVPSVGFFGTPEDEHFEFIYTGHHVTRRCNAHTDTGQGFGGAPIFYGNFAEGFRESKDHIGNPYWYQGLLFNEFVQTLDGKQQNAALLSSEPRGERPQSVTKKRTDDWPGLPCSELSADQKQELLATIRKMLVMFREDDVAATMKTIESRVTLDKLHLSYYDGRYDIGSDKVWDTWQIEGPDMVWYFRGVPHIHTYFHIRA